MKKFIPLTSIIVLALCVYVVTKPYVTVQNIKDGFLNNDSVALSENIDYPALRQNIKDQINTSMIKNAAENAQDNPFASMATGLVTMMTDKIVDSMISSGGMAAIMSGKKPSEGETEAKNPDEIFKGARLEYDSIDHFSVWIPNEGGKEVRMVLKRTGLDWKLSNIILPSF